MDKVAQLIAAERNDIFSETAAKLGMTPAVVEKDFWVSWILGKIFSDAALARILIFKGGTSLSKAFQLIERFSEDIDLILDWRVLVEAEDPASKRSNKQQEQLNKRIDQEAQSYISDKLLVQVQTVLGEICECEIAQDDPHVINVRYPAAFPDNYLRPEVLLEIGPLAAWLPHEEKVITCYAAEVFPKLFTNSAIQVRVTSAERTFWEKATILHQEAYRPVDKPQPPRYSRHYYDMAMMAISHVRATALANLDLLENVVSFKQRFYPRGWARYDLAVPGGLKLVPTGAVLKAVEDDYKAMANMIFGEIPAFDKIMEILKDLENEINGVSAPETHSSV